MQSTRTHTKRRGDCEWCATPYPECKHGETRCCDRCKHPVES